MPLKSNKILILYTKGDGLLMYFLRVEADNYLEELGVKSLTEIKAADTKFAQTIRGKNIKTTTIIKLKEGIEFDENRFLNGTTIKRYEDSQLEEVLKELEELTYRVYQPETYAESIRGFDFETLGLSKEATEQERLKAICEEGKYGIKPFSNLDNVRRW